jgi:hypothetical protein
MWPTETKGHSRDRHDLKAIVSSNSTKQILLVRYFNPQFVYVLMVLACILEELTTERGTSGLG